MNPSLRWVCEAIALYASAFWPVARLMNEYPTRMVGLAIPPLLVLLVVIAGWHRLSLVFGTKDSLANLLLFTLFTAICASLTSALYLALVASAFTSDPGEYGEAFLLIMGFGAILFSFLALPPAMALPRFLDPRLRLGTFGLPR